jgi:hypothetical protein
MVIAGVKMAEAWSYASPKFFLVRLQAWAFMSSGAPSCSVARRQVSAGLLVNMQIWLLKRLRGQENRRSGEREITPPSKDPLDPHPPEKWGRSRAQDVDWICSSGSALPSTCLLQFGADAGRELAVLCRLEADPIVA